MQGSSANPLRAGAARTMAYNAPSAPAASGSDYKLGRRLDRGGPDEVFEAFHASQPGRLAIKLARRATGAPPQAAEAFRRETALVARLRHPHTVQVVEIGRLAAGVPFVVMEFLPGQTLRSQLGRRGPMPGGGGGDLAEGDRRGADGSACGGRGPRRPAAEQGVPDGGGRVRPRFREDPGLRRLAPGHGLGPRARRRSDDLHRARAGPRRRGGTAGGAGSPGRPVFAGGHRLPAAVGPGRRGRRPAPAVEHLSVRPAGRGRRDAWPGPQPATSAGRACRRLPPASSRRR